MNIPFPFPFLPFSFALVEVLIDWTWTYFTRSREPQVLDRTDAARIDWQDDPEERPKPGR